MKSTSLSRDVTVFKKSIEKNDAIRSYYTTSVLSDATNTYSPAKTDNKEK